MSTTPSQYAEKHYDQFVDELKELIRIPSVSAQPKHQKDIKKAAQWLADRLKDLGVKKVKVYKTGEKKDGNPVVYGEWLEAGKDVPTVIVYGHYDVQPADKVKDGWATEPFEPTIKDDKLYARGATDDKGQMFIHFKVFESFIKSTGKFPVNIKFLLEGEEEVGSENLAHFVRTHTDLLKADIAVISDTGIPALDMPTIVYGLRGLVYTELEVWGPDKDLHSGMYGGTVHNPAQAIAEIIATMHDGQGHVTVQGFYDAVRPLDEDERKMSKKMNPLFEKNWKKEVGAPQMYGEPEFIPEERIGARPTLEINGIGTGFYEKGGQKTVIPATAIAKISCRLVPDQDPKQIFELLKAHIAKVAPPTVNWELRELSSSRASISDYKTSSMQVAVKAFEHSFGKAPVFVREGGSIPVVLLFQEVLKSQVVMLGFGLPDDNLHGPNEKLSLEMFRKGIQTCIYFFEELGKKK